MCQAIAAAYRVDEVKDIRDKALAIETYARQAKNVEAERQACEIRLRVGRKAGQPSAALAKSPGRRTDLTSPHRGKKSEALAKAGISVRQAEQWEHPAAVPEDYFERAVKADKPTTSGIIAAAKPKTVSPVSDDALWLWGRLCGIKRRGLLDKDPEEVCSTMLNHMKKDVLALAPKVGKWLERIR